MISPGLNDVKTNVSVPVDRNVIAEQLKSFTRNECFDLLIGTLSDKERHELFTSFASEYWATNKHGPRDQASFGFDDDADVSKTNANMWNAGLFDGRETPMTSGFRPNSENFSRRDENPSNDPSLDPSFGHTAPSPAIPFNQHHDPAGTVPRQGNSIPLGSTTIPQGQPATSTPAFSGPTGTTSLSPFVAPGRFGPTNTTTFGQPSAYAHPMGTVKAPPPSVPYNTTTSSAATVNPPVQPPQFSSQAPRGPAQNTNQRFNAGPALSSGLLLRSVARPNAYTSYDNDRVVVSRTQRGSTDKERAKIRELCTEAITPPITRGNITKLLGTSGTDYDIAEDATRWQSNLANIWSHIVQYDFKLIAMIPLSFDPTDSTSVNQNSDLVNCVLEHDRLTDYHYFAWQFFLRQFARDEELTSDAWLGDKLWKSLDLDLRAEVRSDFDELPHEQKGSISLLRLIIKRMVQSTQESRRAMEEFIRNFDIQKFPGEDVTKASLRIKAIAQSIGTKSLPADIVQRVLEGFARSSTPAFSNLCFYQGSMLSSSLMKHNLRQDNLYQTLTSVLGDLEVRYHELLSGNSWLGVGNSAAVAASTFISLTDIDPDGSDAEEYDEYVAFTAYNGKHVPFDEWVKDKICRNCNEVGHIRRNCPKLQRMGRFTNKTNNVKSSNQSRRLDNSATRDTTSTKPTSSRDEYTSKIKALITAARDLATSSVHVASSSTDNDHVSDTSASSVDDGDHSGFLAALGLGYPKE